MRVNNVLKSGIAALALIAIAAAIPATAATKLVEISSEGGLPGAIFEARCSQENGATTIVGTLTLKNSGVVNLSSGYMSVSGPLPETSTTDVSDQSIEMTSRYFATPAAVFIKGSVTGVTADDEQVINYWIDGVRVGCDRFRFD